mgnify:CR=1 FL=1
MQRTKQFWYGITIGILGIVLFSSKAVMVKLAYNYQVDAISILLLRMLFSFPFYVVIAYVYRNQNKEVKIKNKDYAWVVFFGFVGYYLASYFDFIGLTYIKASLERIILFLYPTIVLILNKLFLKQPITKTQASAIGLTYLGIVIATGVMAGLAGGFAFYTWMKDYEDEDSGNQIKAGDFVLTVGGYHKNYNVPAHQPILIFHPNVDLPPHQI